jgi:hypothetical protein
VGKGADRGGERPALPARPLRAQPRGGAALALIAFDRWLERRDAARAILLGLAIGIGLLSKFSFVAFFPICAAALLVARVKALRSARGVATIILAVVLAALILWAGYFFDVDMIAHAHPDSAHAPFAKVRIPAPLYWVGLRAVKLHDEVGHLSFLLGRYSERGFWYYFPVVFFYKTPIPFLLLMIAGVAAIARARRGLEFVLMPLALMLFVLTSHINIGIRHILPIYPPLCVVAAAGVAALWRNVKGRVAATLLMAWLVAGVEARASRLPGLVQRIRGAAPGAHRRRQQPRLGAGPPPPRQGGAASSHRARLGPRRRHRQHDRARLSGVRHPAAVQADDRVDRGERDRARPRSGHAEGRLRLADEESPVRAHRAIDPALLRPALSQCPAARRRMPAG